MRNRVGLYRLFLGIRLTHDSLRRQHSHSDAKSSENASLYLELMAEVLKDEIITQIPPEAHFARLDLVPMAEYWVRTDLDVILSKWARPLLFHTMNRYVGNVTEASLGFRGLFIYAGALDREKYMISLLQCHSITDSTTDAVQDKETVKNPHQEKETEKEKEMAADIENKHYNIKTAVNLPDVFLSLLFPTVTQHSHLYRILWLALERHKRWIRSHAVRLVHMTHSLPFYVSLYVAGMSPKAAAIPYQRRALALRDACNNQRDVTI